jgi:hypothetical protein
MLRFLIVLILVISFSDALPAINRTHEKNVHTNTQNDNFIDLAFDIFSRIGKESSKIQFILKQYTYKYIRQLKRKLKPILVDIQKSICKKRPNDYDDDDDDDDYYDDDDAFLFQNTHPNMYLSDSFNKFIMDHICSINLHENSKNLETLLKLFFKKNHFK